MRLLLIEDDSPTDKAIQVMLTREGYVCDYTDLWKDGPKFGKLYNFGAAVLDLMLPELDGIDILRRLRASKVTTPIMIVSGQAKPDLS